VFTETSTEGHLFSNKELDELHSQLETLDSKVSMTRETLIDICVDICGLSKEEIEDSISDLEFFNKF